MRSQFSSKQDSYIPRFTSEDNNTGGTISPNRQGRQGNFFLTFNDGSLIRSLELMLSFLFFFFFQFVFFFSEIHAYDNTAFNPGAHEMEERRDRDSKVEVERLGYEMYNGKHENR